MRTTLLLGLAAACAAIAAPGAAETQSSGHHTGGVHRGHHGGGGDRFGDRRDGRRHRGDAVFVTDFDGGEWALYNNRSWEPDSYNDWWHDRPDRAFPRWVQEQRGGPCDPDRMWWSGSGWHC